MAIPGNPLLQRPMFSTIGQRPMFNLAQTQPPVAAPPVAPLPVAAKLLEVPGQKPPIPIRRNYQREYDSLTETINSAEDETDIPALQAERTAVVGEAARANQPVTEVPIPGGMDPSETDLDALSTAATTATQGAIDRGEVSATDAESDLAKARTQVAALTKKGTATFEETLEAVGLGDKDYTASNYNEKAKEMLGLDKDEADVPDWAAPIFLFGLNLMKAPVSSKTQGATGLSGLLSDIGAAGEAGFKMFAVERERKRKERASVATLASNLRTQDLTLRKQLFSEYLDVKKFNINLQDKVIGRSIDIAKLVRGINQDKLTAAHRTALLDHQTRQTANSARRALNSTLSYVAKQEKVAVAPYYKILGDNPKAMAAFATSFKAQADNILTPKEKTLPESDQLKIKLDRITAPGYYSNLAAVAATKSGVTPTINLTKIDFQGDVYYYDPIALENYVKVVNASRAKAEDKKDRRPLTVTEVLDDALRDPTSPHRRMITGSPSTVIKKVLKVVEGVTTEQYVNETVRRKWFAANLPPTDKTKYAAYQATIREAEPQWLYTGESYIKDKPNFVQYDYTNTDGIKTKYYMDNFAFDRRRKSQPTLTLQDVLLDPDKYPKIIQGKITDYAGRGGNIRTMTVFDNGLKRVIAFDRIAYQNAIDGGQIPENADLATIVKMGIGRYIGKGVPVKEAETFLQITADGRVTSIKAADASGVMQAFSSKADQTAHRNRAVAVIDLNMVSWDIREILKTQRSLRVATEALDWAGSAASLSRLIKTRLGYSNSSVTSLFREAAVTKNTRGFLDSALKSFDKDADFGGVLIKDKAVRGQLKSMFLNLAFALASAREGGKLTDNDVRNALITLGWDGNSWTQTPEDILASLSTAVLNANNKYITDAGLRMSSVERAKLGSNAANNKPGMIESMLRNRAKDSPDPRAGAMVRHWLKHKGVKDYTLRFDYSASDEGPAETGGRAPLVAVDKSFSVGEIPSVDLGMMAPQFSKARIPNIYRFAHTQLFQKPDQTPITYDSPAQLKTAARNHITDIYKGKVEGYKHNGLTSREMAGTLQVYINWLYNNKFFIIPESR
jgi:hypothetical protein